jgi:hypothetical protein
MNVAFPRIGRFLLILFLVSPLVRAEYNSSQADYDAKIQEPRFHTKKDFYQTFPGVTMLPQRFLFTGDYAVNLTVTEMRIDHIAQRSRCTVAKRICILSLSYAQPVGTDFFSSRFDFPLFSASSLGSDWSRASFGDYVIYLSNQRSYSRTMRLLASARF